MKDATFTWQLPTTRVEGGPLPVEEIAGVDIYLSGDGGSNFSLLDRVLPGSPQELVQVQLSQGDYVARAVVVDTQDKQSAPSDLPFNVPDESEPGQVVSFGVTLT